MSLSSNSLHVTQSQAFYEADEYSRSVPCTGNPEEVIEKATDLLIVSGFQIDRQSPTEVTATGKGINSTRENPLRGASEIHFRCTSGTLSLHADLSGAMRLKRFAIWFPFVLCSGIAVVGCVAFTIAQAQFPAAQNGLQLAFMIVPAVCFLAAAPWFFLGPMLAKRIESNTREALDLLLTNIAKQP